MKYTKENLDKLKDKFDRVHDVSEMLERSHYDFINMRLVSSHIESLLSISWNLCEWYHDIKEELNNFPNSIYQHDLKRDEIKSINRLKFLLEHVNFCILRFIDLFNSIKF